MVGHCRCDQCVEVVVDIQVSLQDAESLINKLEEILVLNLFKLIMVNKRFVSFLEYSLFETEVLLGEVLSRHSFNY